MQCGTPNPKKIYVGDFGVVFRFQVLEPVGVGSLPLSPATPVDISGFSTLRVDFRKPDNTLLAFTHATNNAVALVDGGLTGIFQLKAASGDLDADGTWKVQGSAILPNLLQWSSDVICFEVLPRLAG